MGKLKVISLFAGPGAGKSTTAAALFARMKRERFDVELVTEYAKDLTWEKSFGKLSNQLHVLAEQNYRLARLEGQAEYAVTDSPIALSLIYGKPEDQKWLTELVEHLWWGVYVNLPFVLKRTSLPFQQMGRNQNLEQALELDARIYELATKQFGAEHVVDPDHPDCIDYMLRTIRYNFDDYDGP